MSPGSYGTERAMVPPVQPRSYYGLPIVKRPAWTIEVPWYFFVGGATGALAATAMAARRSGQGRLARRARRMALLGSLVSPILLISDLGRPERFLNMLRVFRPTSPMSVGSWTLVGLGSALGAGEMAEQMGLPGFAVTGADTTAGVLGPILSTYTAVLIGNTANPIWRGARHLLPFVFAGSSLASAGAAVCVTSPVGDAQAGRRMVGWGTVLEQGAGLAMERKLGDLARPYREGRAGTLNRWQRFSSLAGSALVVTWGRRSRRAAVIGSALTLAGSAALRQSIYQAGFQSAEDPRYLVESQS